LHFAKLKKFFKDHYEIEHLADIARELDVSPQAISNWKARDRVPYKYISIVREKIKDINNFNDKDSKDYIKTVKPIEFNPGFVEDNSVSLLDITLIILKYLHITIIIALIFSIIMFFHVQFRLTPFYQSTAKIMSSSSSSSSQSATSGIAAQFGINIPFSESGPQWVYPEILTSRTIARSMLQRKFDTIKYGPQKTLFYILTDGNNTSLDNYDAPVKVAIKEVISMIQVDQNGSFYDLIVTANEPILARDITSALIEELDNHQRKYNKEKTSKTRQFIEDRIFETEKELNFTEEALKDFRDQNRRLENSPSLLLEQQRISREVAVLTGVFTTLKQQLETTKIEVVKESEYVIVLDPPEAPIERSGPNKKRMIIIAGFVGIGLGLLVSFILEYLNQAIYQDKKKLNEIFSVSFSRLNIFKRFIPFRK